MVQSHTILGSKSQRGLTQLSLDLLFRSLDGQVLHPERDSSVVSSLNVADPSEAQILPASEYLDGFYGDLTQDRGNSRAATPMTVGEDTFSSVKQKNTGGLWNQWSLLGLIAGSSPQARDVKHKECHVSGHFIGEKYEPPSRIPSWNTPRLTKAKAKLRFGNNLQDTNFTANIPRRHFPQRPSALPQAPDVSTFIVPSTSNADYAILVSMYEVYNDRIFDLLIHPQNQKDLRRRPLLFKSTEGSPDRKVVAGLRKVVCSSYGEALMVLETGLTERRVAGTGSNSVSSRSHGFFCVEVKKRARGGMSSAWSGAQLTVVDLAGIIDSFAYADQHGLQKLKVPREREMQRLPVLPLRKPGKSMKA